MLIAYDIEAKYVIEVTLDVLCRKMAAAKSLPGKLIK
jgi:hypothetical protein